MLDALHARLGDVFSRARHRLERLGRPVAHGGAGLPPGERLRRLPRARARSTTRVRRRFTDAARPVFANTAFLALHYVPQPRDAVLAFLLERDEPLVEAHRRPLPRGVRGA